MSARARWIVVGVVLLLLLGLVALYWFNTNLTKSTDQERGPKTWVTDEDTTLTVQAEELHPDDRFGCSGPSVEAPPFAFSKSVSGGTVRTAGDGSVTLRCYGGDIAST